MGVKLGKHYHPLNPHPHVVLNISQGFLVASLNLTPGANIIDLSSLLVIGTLNVGDFAWKSES